MRSTFFTFIRHITISGIANIPVYVPTTCNWINGINDALPFSRCSMSIDIRERLTPHYTPGADRAITKFCPLPAPALAEPCAILRRLHELTFHADTINVRPQTRAEAL